MFFRTKLRGFLLGSNTNEDGFHDYLRETGTWLNNLATKYDLMFSELMEANYLYNELGDKTNKLITGPGKRNDKEAREKFNEVEAAGDNFLASLKSLEKRIKGN